MQSLIHVATELGLGTCWIANFSEKELKKAVEIPDDWRIVAMTPLGYPDKIRMPVRNRKPIESIIRFHVVPKNSAN